MKTIGVIVIAFAMLIALTGVVMADQVVPPVPEVQGITSQVSMNVVGSMSNSAALGWSLTDENMYDTGLATRDDQLGTTMLDATQIQYSSTYDASTIAQGGQTVFIKNMAVGTGAKLLTQSNIKATTEMTYAALAEGGNVLGSEQIMVDGAGMPTSASDRILCPFGNGAGNVIPAYCNIALANSKYDLSIGSVVSTADDRFVGTDATLPVVLNLGINVKPYTIPGSAPAPAMGSVGSSYKVSIKEGRTGYWGNVTALAVASPSRIVDGSTYTDYTVGGVHATNVWHPAWQQLNWQDVTLNMAYGNMTGITPGPQNEDLTYTETSSGAGQINSYSAAYQYQSGKALLP